MVKTKRRTRRKQRTQRVRRISKRKQRTTSKYRIQRSKRKYRRINKKKGGMLALAGKKLSGAAKKKRDQIADYLSKKWESTVNQACSDRLHCGVDEDLKNKLYEDPEVKKKNKTIIVVSCNVKDPDSYNFAHKTADELAEKGILDTIPETPAQEKKSANVVQAQPMRS